MILIWISLFDSVFVCSHVWSNFFSMMCSDMNHTFMPGMFSTKEFVLGSGGTEPKKSKCVSFLSYFTLILLSHMILIRISLWDFNFVWSHVCSVYLVLFALILLNYTFTPGIFSTKEFVLGTVGTEPEKSKCSLTHSFIIFFLKTKLFQVQDFCLLEAQKNWKRSVSLTQRLLVGWEYLSMRFY